MSVFSVTAKLLDAGFELELLDAAATGAFRTAVAGLARAAHNEWIRLAQDKLMNSREIYIQGLRQADSFKQTGSTASPTWEIQLVGEMPNNFEFGMPSFDMKAVRPGWLGGRKSKLGKDGKRYVVIPLRHSEFGMPYTGKAGAITGPTLKTQLRSAVQAYGLNRMLRIGGRVAEGATARVPNNAPVHPYLQGLTRVQKGTGKFTPAGNERGSSQLITWRVMSENSKPSSWIHPGLKAQNLLQEVEAYVDREMDSIIDMVVGV